ncbi:pyridoxamine 5'-phosphate oxidase family protein [Jeongeupia naejangsanensis]|uniref:Pyridoxamine 5'-phosphate oxidase family protein n=1 Tax=Jeongeupia naejangsanensis TaxID=613195 RepID=A0ABS2BNR2_9NEIS|nr:pyridoxamine 5'-phosphate oxidase family protein [Jeongeupia naejangsanensis]MBM3117266.1 pyridoxamine 5'-phosphate oxidase family protein [Jeongeupia naejangsanensis]
MALVGWSHESSPFHPGEQAVQARVGVRDKVEAIGRQVVRGYMPDQHREFFAQLPFVVLGAVDADGQPWATLLVGDPGFARSPEPRTLRLDARPVTDDPLATALQAGAPVGLLGIELETRRRNRMNGTVADTDARGISVAVTQSFGNCPQYIQKREYRRVEPDAIPAPPESATVLDEAALARIAAADTFFIATHFAEAGVDTGRDGADVSHRGGKPGFVRVDDNTLVWPDFVGNFHFNTLGNLQANPRAGLLFPDFDSGDLLYLAGRGEIVWDGDELRAFAGAERLVRFRVERVLRLRGRLPLRWALQETSPILAGTGDWQAVDEAVALMQLADRYRPLRVLQRVRESGTITSFHLQPADGLGVVPYQPGQFLPIRIDVPGLGLLTRTYSLSQAADGQTYRISVKREGRVSRHLHDALQAGDLLDAQAPRGQFVLDAASTRPVILLSGGVGITPMLAMLDTLAPASGERHRARSVWFVHAARNGREHAFGAMLRERAAQHAKLRVHVRYSQPDEADRLGHDYDSAGRIDADLLRSLLPLDDYDVYLCGPDGFMRQTYWALRGLGIAKHRIHYEFFGQGEPLEADAAAAVPAPTVAQPVRFERSDRSTEWNPGQTLLEAAEASGLSPAYSCRAGLCGSCSTPLRSGEVCYPNPPAYTPREGEALICCAMPVSPVVLAL